jgi:pyruvate dehydrogenase E2 component (dihydrolipoamide acetyltransferase)
MTDIKLPELKENVETVEVNAVLVKPGDAVTQGQSLLEVQADKAALDVPSPAAGKIGDVRVKVGDQIKVGQVIFTIEAGAPDEKPATPASDAPTPKAVEKAAPKPADEKAAPKPAEARQAKAPPSPSPVREAPASPQPDGHAVVASPATRRLARELGVDLHQVSGSGRAGRVTQDDVKSHVRTLASGAAPASAARGVGSPPLPRFEEVGAVERQPLDRLRQLTARQMSLAWQQIPHVTQHDEADITDLEAFRKSRDGKGPKLTVTAFALKACAVALKQFPTFNASLDAANNQLILKRYYHLGVAVDTPRGLLVPVIRDVDQKSIEQLAAEVAETAERARQGKADMSGGTFTITNLGGIGGTGFTPIINWPEVAILGLSRGKLTPVMRDGQIVPRLLLPLSLSYDHRVIDGAAAARFTRMVAELLENPWMMALKG